MWLAGTPTRIIAETLRISADRCDVTRRTLGLPRRESWHGAKTGKRTAYLPSEEEIRQKCLEIQAGWSEEERSRRLVGWSQNSPAVEIRIVPESLLYHNPGRDTSIEELIDRDTSGRD